MPRVRKQRDLDMELPEAPRLCNRATGSRWRPAAGSELEGEAAEPSAEGAHATCFKIMRVGHRE